MAIPTTQLRTFPNTVDPDDLNLPAERLAVIAGQQIITTGLLLP